MDETWKFRHRKRWIPPLFSSKKTLLTLLWTVGFLLILLWQSSAVDRVLALRRATILPRPIPKLRPVAFDLGDFGGVGDGVTVNTEAFERAVSEIRKRGGGQLNVQRGTWLSAPFNLTSHMTLFVAEDAVILAIDDEKYWPLMSPLPSYGSGREHPGPRYGSFIHGQNLKDVVITGHNGTINGQGQTWWEKHRKKLLNHTRGPLVQIMWSRDIQISDITFRDSPFWTLHPYDCNNVTIRNVTVLAPLSGAPNTDGIDPDSCENVVIEDCYISVGDDGVAIKSGWDQYGIVYGRPSTNILIRNLIVRSTVSAGISIGSEMSGGVSAVTVENLHVWDSKRAVRIKTSAGRGGYIRDIMYQNLTFDNVRVGVVIKTDYNEHPDEGYDPKALPIVENISFTGIHGQGVRIPVRIYGSQEIPVKNVTFRDMSVGITYKKKHIFQCSFVQGRVIGRIFPAPCENLDIYDEQGRLVKQSTQENSPDIDDES
ncbi:probable polygalacturonase [Diospyros lotus]|uniref:probable polygalacturonase n=1 Tax=Diospyros lotus TaxID=55363 RepID=UPI0022548CF8|nr:probable polygalacturonase [Diospyros lotus]XP_052182825.1 probable polygalacturonase [Diospyros lotus]XP_052182826.1 probable polygalacturonase [Diospyros lotus]XP_052182827.1 probable polygalacturonase [Diospyros lotus]XP_052182828.1 probable polygalacturonase [Diospyros lotus]